MLTPEMERLKKLIVDLNESETLDLVHHFLDSGQDPADLLLVFRASLEEVGRLYEEGEYFIIGLIMAGELMLQAMTILMPTLMKTNPSSSRGLVLLGTIEGDIHDLGKRQTAYLLAANGFEVLDLGVDVAPADFWVQAILKKPVLIGVSIMMRACLGSLKKMVRQLRTAYAGQMVPPIFVSGGAVTPDIFKLTGADFYVADAFDALDLSLKIAGVETSSSLPASRE
jgi:5-methyltetrahydrofolate--homocysteine methyltransferase